MSNNLHQSSSHENIPHSLMPLEIQYLEDFVRKCNGAVKIKIIELLMETNPIKGKLHFSGGKYYFQNKILDSYGQQLLIKKSELFKKKIVELMDRKGYIQLVNVSTASSEAIIYFIPKHHRGENGLPDDPLSMTRKVWLKFMKIFGK